MSSAACPFGGEGGSKNKGNGGSVTACPLGYQSSSFKLGPFSCVICRALLFSAARCVPCRHVFCSGCISRFKDCPVCGADIAGLDEDSELQTLVDQFIQGHARLRRPNEPAGHEPEQVAYEDASVARGSFLLQHAMRAFQAENLESAKSRLQLCVEDTREMLGSNGESAQICSQLGAVLGLMADCLRSMGELQGAMETYGESVETLDKIIDKDTEVVHALSVSLNKLGDMKYYADDLKSAHGYYKRALEVREKALGDSRTLSAESMDVVVSLVKVADVERAMGREAEASQGFAQALKHCQSLASPPGGAKNGDLEKKRMSVLEYLHGAAHQHEPNVN